MGVLNASNHPVLVKKIGIHAWSLRDEIEYAVRLRYDESQENGTEPFIEDLKEFYSPKDAYDPSNLIAQGLDSTGNPMDEEAMAMLAAMQGGDEESEESQEENKEEENKEEENKEEENKEEENKEEDNKEEDNKEEENKEEISDDDANAMAAAMLEGQVGETPKETRTAENYVRQSPGIESISAGFCLLSDMNMENILFFSYNTFLHGQTIALEFQIPRKFIITCEVIKTSDIDRTSKIISESKPRYRVFAKITYNYPGERANLREFIKSIEPDIPPPPSKLKKKDTGGDEDEFEDLGF